MNKFLELCYEHVAEKQRSGSKTCLFCRLARDAYRWNYYLWQKRRLYLTSFELRDDPCLDFCPHGSPHSVDIDSGCHAKGKYVWAEYADWDWEEDEVWQAWPP